MLSAPPFDFASSFSAPIFTEAHPPKFLLTVTNGVHVPLPVNDAGGSYIICARSPRSSTGISTPDITRSGFCWTREMIDRDASGATRRCPD